MEYLVWTIVLSALAICTGFAIAVTLIPSKLSKLSFAEAISLSFRTALISLLLVGVFGISTYVVNEQFRLSDEVLVERQAKAELQANRHDRDDEREREERKLESLLSQKVLEARGHEVLAQIEVQKAACLSAQLRIKQVQHELRMLEQLHELDRQAIGKENPTTDEEELTDGSSNTTCVFDEDKIREAYQSYLATVAQASKENG